MDLNIDADIRFREKVESYSLIISATTSLMLHSTTSLNIDSINNIANYICLCSPYLKWDKRSRDSLANKIYSFGNLYHKLEDTVVIYNDPEIDVFWDRFLYKKRDIYKFKYSPKTLLFKLRMKITKEKDLAYFIKYKHDKGTDDIDNQEYDYLAFFEKIKALYVHSMSKTNRIKYAVYRKQYIDRFYVSDLSK